MERSYYPAVTINGEEWVGYEPMNCANAYDEAVRMKTERNAEKACIKVCIPDFVIVHSWKEGKYTKHKGIYLYAIPI